jgi:hypothetical protein
MTSAMKEQLTTVSNEIDADIIAYIKNEDEGVFGVKDGIIDIDRYIDKNPKILWVLKDAYEIGGDGGFDLREQIRLKKSFSEFASRPTYETMAWIAYGVYNNVLRLDDIKKAPESDLMNCLKSIAYINLKKLPITEGGVYSDMNAIETAYNQEQDKKIIHRQLKDYVPQFIIGGNTTPLLVKGLGLTNQKKIFDVPYYAREGQFYFAVYHPSHVEGKKSYVENIIAAIKHLTA